MAVVEEVLELQVFLVENAVYHVESDRDVLERVQRVRLAVAAHVIEECLFVRQVVVMVQVVVSLAALLAHGSHSAFVPSELLFEVLETHRLLAELHEVENVYLVPDLPQPRLLLGRDQQTLLSLHGLVVLLHLLAL